MNGCKYELLELIISVTQLVAVQEHILHTHIPWTH